MSHIIFISMDGGIVILEESTLIRNVLSWDKDDHSDKLCIDFQ